MTPATFRANLPEFTDPARYPDSQVNRWLSLADIQLSADAWGALWDRGAELFVAHHLSLWRRNADAAATGGTPGQGGGVVSSKAVDKVSASYDTGAATIEGAAQWNLTTYGVQFFQLAHQIGMGAPSIAMGGAVQGMTPPAGIY